MPSCALALVVAGLRLVSYPRAAFTPNAISCCRATSSHSKSIGRCELTLHRVSRRRASASRRVALQGKNSLNMIARVGKMLLVTNNGTNKMMILLLFLLSVVVEYLQTGQRSALITTGAFCRPGAAPAEDWGTHWAHTTSVSWQQPQPKSGPCTQAEGSEVARVRTKGLESSRSAEIAGLILPVCMVAGWKKSKHAYDPAQY